MATNKEEEITPYQLILDKEYLYLSEKIRKYAKLSPEYSTAKAFVIDLIERELENKQLDNTFIELDKPFYFNKNNLYENYTAIATTKKPKANTEEYIKITKVPNNLDLFDTEFNSYCYDNDKNKHLGIDLYSIPTKEALNNPDKEITDEDIKINYIAFEYDTEENIIEVDIIKPEYIKESIDIKQYGKLFYDYELKIKDITEEIASNPPNEIKYRKKPYLEDIGLKYEIKYIWKKIYEHTLEYCMLIFNVYEFSKENEEFFKEYASYRLEEMKLTKGLVKNSVGKVITKTTKTGENISYTLEFPVNTLKSYEESYETEDKEKLEEIKKYLEDVKQSLLNKNKELFLEVEELTEKTFKLRIRVIREEELLGIIAPIFDVKYLEIFEDVMLGIKLKAELGYIKEDNNMFVESELEEMALTAKSFIEERNKTLHGSF